MNYNKTLNLPKTKFSMKADLSNKELGIQKFWTDNEIYKKINEKNAAGDVFVLHDGPPYANGHIHLGHALNRVIKDIVLKYKSLKGYKIPFIPGWDCHGLPIEYELIKKKGSSIVEDQYKFRKAAAAYAERFVDIQRKEFLRLGLFGHWDRPYLTLQKEYEETIVSSFQKLYKKGYIYRELKPVYWCSSCQTALAEAEVEYADVDSPSVFVRFKLKSSIEKLEGQKKPVSALVWTTTPWTLPSNVALCFHPEYDYSFISNSEEILIVADAFITAYEGYEKLFSLKGSELLALKFEAPYSSDDSIAVNGNFVTLEDGTGIVHIAPGHGEDDYMIGKQNSLPIKSPVDEKGCFTEQVGVDMLIGKAIFDCDPIIIEDLKQRGILFDSSVLKHSYPHCWRCKNAIVFRATKQWFLKVDNDGLREKILEKIDNLKWYPETSKNRISAMIQNRPDWCLSRQRLWGVPIPVFYCSDCSEVLATDESFEKVREMILNEGSDGWVSKTASEILGPDIKCACGSKNFEKDSDILDVWFDSGVSSFAVLEKREGLRWPADLYLEGSDQHRGWFQTSIIPAVALRDQAPYKAVLTHGFIVDAEGKKMSKSIGNVISPQDIIKQYGADLLRLWVAGENYFKDIKISQEILEQVVSYYRRIRNTIRFILGNTGGLSELQEVSYEELTSLDKFMLHKLYETVQDIDFNYSELTYYKGMKSLHDFCNIWLSSFYFNILKDRLYVESKESLVRRSSQTVLRIIGEHLLLVMSPVLSHTAEEAWQLFKSEHTHMQYPESVFTMALEKMPGEWNNPEIARVWERIVSLREDVLKAIEQAKSSELFKDPLEAKVIISSSDPVLLELLESRSEEFREYFIVSSVEFLKSDIELDIKIEKAAGAKCVRCWLISDELGTDLQHPELCPRCTSVVHTIPIEE